MARSQALQSIFCCGLDPKEDHIPPKYGDPLDLDNWWAYLNDVITLAAQYAAVCKPQSAYYERVMRKGGMQLLFKVISRIRELGVLSILDAKRQDIGSTDSCYADWIVGEPDNGIGYGFGACTRNIYLGNTFVPNIKGIFDLNGKEKNWWPYMLQGKMPIMMCRTSNDEAPTLLQDLELPNGQLVYQWVASQIGQLDKLVGESSDGVACIGAVVGATYPTEAELCRQLAPDAFFLIPGYGKQGGDAAGAVAGFPINGRCLGTVNSSRGITMAWRDKDGNPKPGDPLEHVEAAMVQARDELNAALQARLGFNPYNPEFPRPTQKIVIPAGPMTIEHYLEVLKNCGGYYSTPQQDGKALGPLVGYSGKYKAGDEAEKQYVGFRYFNLATLEEYPHALDLYARNLARRATEDGPKIDCIVGIPNGGRLLGESVARCMDVRFAELEKKVVEPATETSKEVIKLVFSRHAIRPGMRCALNEDLCNNFSTTLLAIQAIEEAGGIVVCILCGLNRSELTDYMGLPVITLVHLPTAQYRQDDPVVAEYVNDPEVGVVWTVKPNWPRLERVMADAQAQGVSIV
jgi:orotidine-5'-phosphate decarboxylase